jgi:hypothetical protein
MGVWNSAEESLRMKFDAEAALRDLQEIGARHLGWKGLGADDQARISELLADLVQALPDGQAQARSGQAEQ